MTAMEGLVMKDSDREALEKEISRNYDAFSKMKFSPQDKGKIALLHDGKLVDILDSRADAHKVGKLRFTGGEHYSVQEIDAAPADLGWFSHVVRSH